MEKGLLLDAGRKSWTREFLCQLLKLMAENGLTHLQYCFASADEDLSGLFERCQALGLTLVPSFNSPGHMEKLLVKRPEFGLLRSDGSRDSTALDVTNPEAVSWAFEQWDKVLSGLSNAVKRVHVGADEFIAFEKLSNYPEMIAAAKNEYGAGASGLEPYVSYVNQLVKRLSDRGVKCRVWNDGFFRSDAPSLVELTRDVEVCYWSNWDKHMAPVETWLDKGYTLLNFCDNQLYYVLGENAGYSYPTADRLSRDFTPNLFSGKVRLSARQMAAVKGCYFSIWSDIPDAQSEVEVLDALHSLLPAFSKKME